MTASETKAIPVGISGRHVHLSQNHLEMLFGDGYELSKLKDLTQPGQFAAKETVTIVGLEGIIEDVRVLGPVRGESQVEISRTDAFRLGVDPPVRDSGNLINTPGVVIVGSKGAFRLSTGVIIAARHIHMNPVDAQRFGLKDREKVKVHINGERATIFENVIIRVNDSFTLEMHLDTDEANAALIEQGAHAYLM